jgi:hypothetical protein
MSYQIVIVLFSTLIIYIVGSLAYAARVVGVKTGKIAIAFAVFNIFALISRTANTIQAPLLAKVIENNITQGTASNLLHTFRLILITCTIATLVGAVLMPTFIKLLTKAVNSFSIHRSIPKLLIHGFSKAGVEQFKSSIAIPKRHNIAEFKNFKRIPKKLIILNTLAFSLSTVGVLASLYACCLDPSIRITSSTLSSVINGCATIIMFVFIDPFISMMTDDVIRGEAAIEDFNRCIIFILGGQVIGTILSQLLLIPAAIIILKIAIII